MSKSTAASHGDGPEGSPRPKKRTRLIEWLVFSAFILFVFIVSNVNHGDVTTTDGWASAGGAQHMQAVSDAMNTLVAGGTTDLTSTCPHLQEVVSDAQSFSPYPDGIVQQHLSAALNDAQQAATYCISAVNTGSRSDDHEAMLAAQASGREATLATARINEIRGN